jgi:hypothetical protein
MKAITTLARRPAKRVLALVLLFVLFHAMRSATEVSPAAKAEASPRFHFHARPLVDG